MRKQTYPCVAKSKKEHLILYKPSKQLKRALYSTTYVAFKSAKEGLDWLNS